MKEIATYQQESFHPKKGGEPSRLSSRYNLTMDGGTLHGLYESYYSDGELVVKGYIHLGQEVGLWFNSTMTTSSFYKFYL